jgi:hypothetical protein
VDSERPKESLTALILTAAAQAQQQSQQQQQQQQQQQGGGGGGGAQRVGQAAEGEGESVRMIRRAELESLSLMALHRRAVSEGVDPLSDLKSAMDSATPKAALVELLMSR